MPVDSAMRTRFAHAVRGVVPILSWIPDLVRDGLGVACLGSIAYGSYLLTPAAGFIVGGLEGVALCALLTAAAGRR